jgi:uncharacterized membrane protein
MGRIDIGPGRLEAFSDGVIAIIVTIMVLELKLPEHVAEYGLVSGLLVPMSPKLISYAMSFLVVAIMWVNHNALMATVRRATRAILWQNNHLLFWMSLIPFATGFSRRESTPQRCLCRLRFRAGGQRCGVRAATLACVGTEPG